MVSWEEVHLPDFLQHGVWGAGSVASKLQGLLTSREWGEERRLRTQAVRDCFGSMYHRFWKACQLRDVNTITTIGSTRDDLP